MQMNDVVIFVFIDKKLMSIYHKLHKNDTKRNLFISYALYSIYIINTYKHNAYSHVK